MSKHGAKGWRADIGTKANLAAPELLSALKAARATFKVEYADDGRIMSVSYGGDALRGLIAGMDAAIAKAEGRS